jgi:prepilin-type N-terminal cleavage/methylation domain-containing protein
MKATNNSKGSRGFTLLELLVTIALIGLAASIILVAVSNARGKGNDSKVRSQLISLRTAAENYYAANSNYGAAVAGTESAGSGATASVGTGCASGMFSNTALTSYTLAANYPSTAAGTGKCTSSGQAYAVTVRLNDSTAFWCVDSAKASRQTSALQANSTYTCP